MSRFEQLLEYLKTLQSGNVSINFEKIVLVQNEIDKELGIIKE